MATIIVEQKSNSNRIKIEIDATKFERLAANLGLFSKSFLSSLDKSEKEAKQGKLTRLSSFKDLRNA